MSSAQPNRSRYRIHAIAALFCLDRQACQYWEEPILRPASDGATVVSNIVEAVLGP